MSDDRIANVALEIFRRSKRMGGIKRPAADQEWRDLGPAGRSPWRELAKAALDAFGVGEGAKAAANTPAKPEPKPPVASTTTVIRKRKPSQDVNGGPY